MTRRVISLNDSNWRFGSVAQKPFGDVNDLAEVNDWLPATVPGDIRLDLLRAGKISDPFFAANNEESQWVDSRDWWYIRDLPLEHERDERAFLLFAGIDYQSAVFFGEDATAKENAKPATHLKQLGRHAGMFSQQIYELSTKDNGRKTSGALQNHKSEIINHRSPIAVRIWGSDALPKLNLSLAQRIWANIVKPLYHPPDYPFPDRYATLKSQMQFGWDFAPRLRTCGIWDDACLVVTRSVFIENAFIKSKVDTERVNLAHVSIDLLIDSDREQAVRVVCNLNVKRPGAEKQTIAFDLSLTRGVLVRQVAFDLADAQLWNPWDRGEPNLYAIEIRIESKDGEQLDGIAETFGIREFHLERAPHAQGSAEPWQFVVNGKREFLRGANWVPLDAIPARLTRADYAVRLSQARAANVNFLRVWGGGLREKRAFCDLCDELGILVWQEFPFAGAILDRFPTDREFLQLVRTESSAIVRALRNHPSLVVWCGGNEFSVRGNRKIVSKLRGVVKDKDGTRPFKPASPFRDESHNWRIWHRQANLRDYRRDESPLLSEFGLQALPNLESLEKFLPAEALQKPHPLWEYHHAQLKKLGRYAAAACPADSTSSMSTERFIDATQRAQAMGLQIAIEHMRRRKPQTAGVAIWQLNDAWPAISWSVIDYYGTPKRAYGELVKLYSPVLASFDYALVPRKPGDHVHGDLWIINDLLSSYPNAEVGVYLNGREILIRRINIAPDSATRLDRVELELVQGDNLLRLKVGSGSVVLSDHDYDLNYCDTGEIGLIDRIMAGVGKRLMR
jgi:beta-mannosidase